MRTRFAVVAVSLVLAATACSSPTTTEGPGTPPSGTPSSSTPPSSEPAPTATPTLDQGRRVTSADAGATLHLAVGGNADLVVRDPVTPEPTVSGDSITLVEVDSAVATGEQQWEVRAVGPGTSELTATEHGRTFTVRFEVVGR